MEYHSSEKKQRTDMCNNLRELQKHYSEENKPNSKGYTCGLYTILELTKLHCRGGTQISGGQALGKAV